MDFCYCANPLDTQQALTARTEQHAERLFKIIDINGDGNLTETECLRVRICFDKVWFVVLGAVHKLCQPRGGWKMLTLADKGGRGAKANADIRWRRRRGVGVILTSLTNILKMGKNIGFIKLILTY